jgi:hypothetical protein
MVLSPKVRSVVAGVLVANSAPHLATAVAGRQHLTPLAGRDSPPALTSSGRPPTSSAAPWSCGARRPSASPATGTTGWSPSRPAT